MLEKYDDYSVLMSVYYKENPKYLSIAIESILNQTVKTNDFVIVCDGPLSAELNEVIFKYETNYSEIKILRLEENMGLGKALNFGLSHCINNLIGRMDSDDISDVNRFKYLLEEYNNTKADVIGGYIEEFYGNVGDTKNIRRVPLTTENIMLMIKKRNPMNHVSVLFKKDAVEKAGGYIDLPYVEDYYLWIRMLKNNFNLVNIDKVVAYVRTGSEMYKRRGNKKQIKGWIILQKEMLSTKIINPLDMICNILIISVFVCFPTNIRKIIYEKRLRSKSIKDK